MNINYELKPDKKYFEPNICTIYSINKHQIFCVTQKEILL